MSLQASKQKILTLNENRLISIQKAKKLQIEEYFKQIANQVITMSNSFMVVDAMDRFTTAFHNVDDQMAGKTINESKLRERYSYQQENTPGANSDAIDRWFPSVENSKILQSFYISENPSPSAKNICSMPLPVHSLTTEAARAGEAGKGFAVVANEVKELANQTAKATENISTKIQAIQTDTSQAVSSISEITDIVNRINDIATSIASMVEEQTATTNEMSRNVQEAATGSIQIAENTAEVAKPNLVPSKVLMTRVFQHESCLKCLWIYKPLLKIINHRGVTDLIVEISQHQILEKF